MDRLLPTSKNSPFYRGFLFYLILLFPLVVISALVQRIQQQLGALTVTHHLFFANLYFASLFLACFMMSVFSRGDILLVFRHRNESFFEAFVLIHGLCLLFHLGLHALVALSMRGAKEATEGVALLLCSAHYYQHAFRPAVMDQDPSTGIWVFVFYSLIFGLISFEKGMVRYKETAGQASRLLVGHLCSRFLIPTFLPVVLLPRLLPPILDASALPGGIGQTLWGKDLDEADVEDGPKGE